MAIITNLTTLKSAVADQLHRTDLSAAGGPIEIGIQSAEQRFQRDYRVREPGSNNAVLVSLFTTDPNWLLTAEPDIYLYATLVEMTPYLKNFEEAAYYNEQVEQRIDALSGSVRLNPNRTALAVTSYAELQTTVADMLERGDLKNVIPLLVVMAERKLHRDHRVRNLERSAFSITADDIAVPAGLKQVESWYLDGPTYYGSIDIVPADQLAVMKARLGMDTGAPRVAANLDGVFRFGPAPDTTYASKLTYWQGLTALASGVNWLYTSHPDIYLLATAIEAEPWAKRDRELRAMIAGWKPELEARLEGLHLHIWNEQWGGDLVRQINAIGG